MASFPTSFHAFESGWRQVTALLLSFVFVALCSVSHTVALRYVIQVVLLALAFPPSPALLPLFRKWATPLALFAMLVCYAALHAFLLSYWTEQSVAEVRSQLVIPALWLIAGLTTFYVQRRFSIVDVVIAGGIFLALAEFGLEAYHFVKEGSWPYLETFSTATHLEFTFFINFVLAFVVSSLCFGNLGKSRPTKFSKGWLMVIICLFVFVSLRAAARNGMIGMAYLSMSMLVLYSLINGQKKSLARMAFIWVVVLVTMGALVTYAIKKDVRNLSFVESVKEGWDYQHHPAWTGIGKLPLMPNGQTVDDSAFKRTAYIHSGLDLMMAKPLGYGFDRGVFHKAAEVAGIKNAFGHAHSGFIDLAVSLGVPGLVLWFGFCMSLFLIGYRQLRFSHNVLGLMLMLMVGGFVGRMMIESIFRDHELQLFMFVAGALLAEMSSQMAGGLEIERGKSAN